MNSAARPSSPGLDSEYSLGLDAIDAFRRDGHVAVRGLCSREEVSRHGEAIMAAVRRLNPETRPLHERNTYGKAFLQTTNLWEFDEAVAVYSCSPRFAKVAAELLGVDSVRMYHDQALFKEAGGGHTPWHQDQFYWPLDCPTVTMWMALVDANDQMGTMHFADGSHRDGSLATLAISDESESFFEDLVREKGYPIAKAGALSAGDATFHGGWTLHSAGPNRTDSMRAAMTVIYFPDGARIVEPDHDSRRHDLERWFPGLKPGDQAASPINPVLWSRIP